MCLEVRKQIYILGIWQKKKKKKKKKKIKEEKNHINTLNSVCVLEMLNKGLSKFKKNVLNAGWFSWLL